MMGLRGLADDEATGSFANRMRDRRFRVFEELLTRYRRTRRIPLPDGRGSEGDGLTRSHAYDGAPAPSKAWHPATLPYGRVSDGGVSDGVIEILDVGGTNDFWEKRGWAGRKDVRIVTVNLKAEEQKHENIVPRVGDATDLREWGDKSVDVVFSNSVIEHLFTWEKQAAMAREVRRVGRAYWVQTPNYWFPMEPHFHVPGWQWLPEGVRVAAIRRRKCGWRGPCRDLERARALVREIRLLTWRELRELFPGGTIEAERFCGVVKSWMAWGIEGAGDSNFPRP